MGAAIEDALHRGVPLYFNARATVYTITTRRLVMRIGVALPTTFNLPFKQIGEVVGVPENTVKSRMRYALDKLRTELADFNRE